MIKINDVKIKERLKRRGNLKSISCICAACITSTMLLGINTPVYASDIPSTGSIFSIFNDKTYEHYDKYASDLNITKESNGLKITINKVVYDEIKLSIFYTVESQNKFETQPMFPGAELKINGKETSFGSGGNGQFFNDDKTYVGIIEYDVAKESVVPKDVQDEMCLGGYIKIPDKFVLSLNIDEILSSGDKDIKGNWNFDIPVTNEKVAGKINEQNCDIDLSKAMDGYNINKLITTPLNTSIQGIIKGNNNNNDHISFFAFDDKGRYIPCKSSEGHGHKEIMYVSSEFKEVYDDTENITFTPYKYNHNTTNKSKNDINAKLNLQGETKLYSNNGEEYANITRVTTENGKTKIYYRSKYGMKVSPIEIINNKTGEKILSINESSDRRNQEENIAYLNANDEYVITCDKELKGDDFSIKCSDISESIEVYNNSKFTIKIK